MIEESTRRWVAAWAHTRRLEVTEVLGWPMVHVGQASRASEIVCAEPSEATWAALMTRIAGEPSAMLSVVAAQAGRYVEQLPAGVRLDRDDEVLMQVHHGLVVKQRRRPPVDLSAYHRDIEEYDERVTLRLTTKHSVVAEGTVGLLGTQAVYDCVETGAAHRRRGLASGVMLELGRIAVARGATTGLLVATAEGARLYRSLGWTVVAPMRSLMGCAHPETPMLRKWNRF